MKKLFRIIWRIIKITLLVAVCVLAAFILLIGAAAILGSHELKIADKSVLVFNLSTRITDRAADEKAQLMGRLMGRDESTIQLRAATVALRQAATDPRISALYMHGNLRVEGYGSGYAAIKELRGAVEEFKKSGKPVIAYLEDSDNRDFYLESAADQILLNPFGIVAFRGLAAQGIFLKGAADKYGFEFTPVRHGKYKSAIEPLTREDFSPENREQLEALVKAIWGDMLDAVATSRKIPADQLQALVDKEGLISAQSAKDKGLVTDIAYESDAFDKLRTLTGTASGKKFPQVSIAKYAVAARRAAAREHHGSDKVAVVYAEGTIIEGEDRRGAQDEVAGDRYARIIRDLREDKDVKALVLRVNSPGGSAEASEVILNELRKFNEAQPVIVSMGTVAASGGYFISMGSRHIFAEPSTITGSIGVFGLTMNAQKIANDHGITFDVVKTGNMADMFSIGRPMTSDEKTVLQNHVDHIYDEFVQRVATGRKMAPSRVDELAQGRVWAGADAVKNGLVDEFGDLQKAIDTAAQDAKLGADYSVIEYPKRKEFIEELAESLRGDEQTTVKNDFVSRVMDKMAEEWRWLSGFNDAQGIYARLPFDLDLN